MSLKKQLDYETKTDPEGIHPADDLWLKQFLAYLELCFIENSQQLSRSVKDTYRVAIRSVVETFYESGVEQAELIELFGEAISTGVQYECSENWTSEMNKRRFELIDRDLQGKLKITEQIELAQLTRTMRHHIGMSENNSLFRAEALHQELLEKQARKPNE